MNTKNIILVASVLTVLGLLTGTIFGVLTLANALLIAPAILGILYGIYERFEKKELSKMLDKVVDNNMELQSQITAYSSTLDTREKRIKDIEKGADILVDLNKGFQKQLSNSKRICEEFESLALSKSKTVKVLEDEIVELRSKLYDAEISNQIDKASTIKLIPLNSTSSEESNNKPKTQRRGPRKENK